MRDRKIGLRCPANIDMKQIQHRIFRQLVTMLLQAGRQMGATPVVVLGSSGVGKSTLINKIIGEDIIQTSEIRNVE